MTSMSTRANLVGLVADMRRNGIEPVLLVMPMHPTFNRVHEPTMSRNYAEMEEIARRERVDVIHPKGDYSDGKYFTDGHHQHYSTGPSTSAEDVAPSLAAVPGHAVGMGSPRAAVSGPSEGPGMYQRSRWRLMTSNLRIVAEAFRTWTSFGDDQNIEICKGIGEGRRLGR